MAHGYDMVKGFYGTADNTNERGAWEKGRGGHILKQADFGRFLNLSGYRQTRLHPSQGYRDDTFLSSR